MDGQGATTLPTATSACLHHNSHISIQKKGYASRHNLFLVILIIKINWKGLSMQIKKYRIADSIIELRIPFLCKEPERFTVFCGKGEPDITVNFEICEERPENLGKLIYSSDIRVFQKEEQFCIEHYVSVREKPYAWLIWQRSRPEHLRCFILEEDVELCRNIAHIFQLIRVEQICMIMGGTILHSSFIKWNKRGILFTAPSGTGKSTQAELWRENQKAEIINGDRAILRKKDGIWKAYGLPYAGSSDIFRNESAPIAAVVILRQAHYNEVQHLRPAEAFKWIYSETIIRSWDEAFQEKVADLIIDLVLHVPVLMLNCLPNEGAVSRLKEELENEED